MLFVSSEITVENVVDQNSFDELTADIESGLFDSNFDEYQ